MELPPEKPAEDLMKLYVLVRESVPLGVAMVSVAHAPLCCFLKFQDDPDMQEWLKTSFRKVVCVVSDRVFESCKKLDRHFVVTESKYDGRETAIVLCPRKEWPRKFHYFRMFGQAKVRCPQCGEADHLDGDRLEDQESGVVSRMVTCGKCGRFWKTSYSLV